MATARVNLYFVVRWGQFNSGSAHMRSIDLSRIVAPHLGPTLRAKVIVMPGAHYPKLQRIWARSRPRGGLYFMTKSALKMDAEASAELKARSLGLCFDYVDHDLGTVDARAADVHVCSSYAQQEAIIALQQDGAFPQGPTQVILHNADSALYGLGFDKARASSAVYCGSAALTSIPARLGDEVEMLDAKDRTAMNAVRGRLAEFTLHYCIRKTQEASMVIKPFTKGITAAMCHANVVVSRDVPDAVRLLGEDYPFMAADNSDGEVKDAFEHVKAAFGEPDWRRGLDAMAGLRAAVSGVALAGQLRAMAELRGVG